MALYTRLFLSLLAFIAAMINGAVHWQSSTMRVNLQKRQQETETKAATVAAARVRLNALEGKLSMLRSLTEEIGPAVAGDIVHVAAERRNPTLSELAQKHGLRAAQSEGATP